MAGRHKGVTQIVIGHPTRRIIQGAGIDKGWEAKQDYGHVLDAFTYNKNDSIADT